MTRPATSDNSSAVGLFPFLAVLLCTMGALLVLLVVLAQRIGGEPVVAQPPEEPTIEVAEVPTADPAAVADLESELEQIQQYQQKLSELRRQGEQRLVEEQERLGHLEDHIRRMEHELVELALAAKQLKATEDRQNVDREQAKSELARLEQLIVDTEKQVEELRKTADKPRSYSVVPFKGKNGTYSKPIYILCDKDGITLQPEGIKLQREDFARVDWPGNPLAVALRASRKYLVQAARRAGQPEPMDPYPLILVRPGGTSKYHAVLGALQSWDAAYGYEFIDDNWKLTYPELPNPELARVQQHAIANARLDQAQLASAAPSKFRNVRGIASNRSGPSRFSIAGPYGAGSGNPTGAAAQYGRVDGQGSQSGGGGTEEDGSLAEGDPGASDGQVAQSGSGGLAGNGGPSDGNEALGQTNSNHSSAASQLAGHGPGGGQAGQPGEEFGEAGQGGGGGDSGQQAELSTNAGRGGSPNAGSQVAGTQGLSRGVPGSESAQAGAPSFSFESQDSIADARGSDWAIQRSRRNAVPLQRPIQVVVRQNQVALLPGRHSRDGAGATGAVIPLEQSLESISEQFSAALKEHVDSWGLAGNGLYWKPVLELNVGPEAGVAAKRLVQLLKNSGVDVRFPQTARAQKGQSANGTK